MVPHGAPGLFVVIEGPHGSGKSTLAASLACRARAEGIPAHVSKEPYTAELLPLIASFSKRSDAGIVLAALIAADRFLHCEELRRRLQIGECVITDRYVPSTLVYQQLQGLPRETVLQWNDFAVRPDLTLLILAPLEARLPRLTARIGSNSFLQLESLRREQDLYERLASDEASRDAFAVAHLDGTQPAEGVLSAALGMLGALPKWKALGRER